MKSILILLFVSHLSLIRCVPLRTVDTHTFSNMENFNQNSYETKQEEEEMHICIDICSECFSDDLNKSEVSAVNAFRI